MKKSVKMAVAASMLAAPTMANASALKNMENPLYLPEHNTVYSKLSNGVMLKVADSSDAHRAKNHNGEMEFPILRIQEELGYGITDNWAVHFSAQYTHDNDIGRTGLSGGRLGTTYRVLNMNNGLIWDVYGDIHLGGLGEMRGQYNVTATSHPLDPSIPVLSGVFDYDNYSDGMWGYHFGTKFGYKINNRLTTSVFAEILRTIGDDNNVIRVVGNSAKTFNGVSTATLLASRDAPSTISVDLKSKTEYSTGINAFYQMSDRWSVGGWFKYYRHDDAGVKKIKTNLGGLEAMKSALEAKLANMKDGFEDYVVGLSVATQATERAQIVLYGEYTFDKSHENSQNGTDVKAEAGVRINFEF